MTAVVSVAVFIPTYNRGTKIFETLRRIQLCDPLPAEIWVHIDLADGQLEAALAAEFPDVSVISSVDRIGPGGGRHRCLQHCDVPLAVSFDDDSYPCEVDFFERVRVRFNEMSDAAVIGAAIWHPHQAELPRVESLLQKSSFTGCGYAIRLSAYRETAGFVPRPVAYGLEETDLSLQLFACNWRIYEAGELRVFHDTALSHHQRPEITECVVANTALLAFLRYPMWLWFWGLLQLGNTVRYCLRAGRWRGVLPGLMRIPSDCFAFRRYRRVLPTSAVVGFLRVRRASP